MVRSIGAPIIRTDATAKVLGMTRYSADVKVPDLTYAALVTSRITRGRIKRMDTAPALAVSGVHHVLTHTNIDVLAPDKSMVEGGRFQSSVNPLGSDQIAYHGQIVALVVADTQEIAEHAASLVRIDYARSAGRAHLANGKTNAEALSSSSIDIGDVEAAFAAADVGVEAEYHTASTHQNPIELYSTTARWNGDALHLDLPSQWVVGTQAGVANAFGMPSSKVTVASAFTGGAFGAKASVLWHTVFTAVAARQIGRPVKLVVSRKQGFTVGSFRPETVQRVRLAATRDGLITGYDHENRSQTSRADRAAFPATHYATHIYAAPNIRAREFLARRDVNTPGYMRAPNEFHGNFAQESAIDELAVELGIDPVVLRILNEPAVDPVNGRPFSSRSLVPCLRRGAELFGWSRRSPEPGSMRAEDGSLIGWGCAAAWYPVYRAPSDAEMRVDRDGGVTLRVSASDMGQGTYTILKQIAADKLGVDVGSVTVTLGSSSLPIGPMAAGSSTTASAGSATMLVAEKMRARLLAEAVRRGPLARRDPQTLSLVGGQIIAPDGVQVAITAIVRSLPSGAVREEARWAPREMSAEKVQSAFKGQLAQIGPFGDTHTMFAFGAQFAEVLVDPLTRRITLGRLIGVFAGGRIINPRTARSQLMGGMIWGASHALMEEGIFDQPRAHFTNTDLGGYHFAVNADIPEVIVEMLHEEDKVVNPLGVKGLGEIGNVGVAPAIASAVYHATGVRVRKTPILIDDLFGANV